MGGYFARILYHIFLIFLLLCENLRCTILVVSEDTAGNCKICIPFRTYEPDTTRAHELKKFARNAEILRSRSRKSTTESIRHEKRLDSVSGVDRRPGISTVHSTALGFHSGWELGGPRDWGGGLCNRVLSLLADRTEMSLRENLMPFKTCRTTAHILRTSNNASSHPHLRRIDGLRSRRLQLPRCQISLLCCCIRQLAQLFIGEFPSISGSKRELLIEWSICLPRTDHCQGARIKRVSSRSKPATFLTMILSWSYGSYVC